MQKPRLTGLTLVDEGEVAITNMEDEDVEPKKVKRWVIGRGGPRVKCLTATLLRYCRSASFSHQHAESALEYETCFWAKSSAAPS